MREMRISKEERFAGKQNSAEEMGNRIAKHISDLNGMLEKSTYYLLDAQGNQISMYEHLVNSSSVDYTLVERNIYGSSLLGVNKLGVNLFTGEPTTTQNLGLKYYHISNHLGNVLTVFSDLKTPITNNGQTVSGYEVTSIQTNDYSPFGVELDGRSSVGSYRYGFQGQEKDDEISGKGNSYTAEFWQYDSRLGRRWNRDPIIKHHESPYASFANNPIWFKDPNGADTTLDDKSRTLINDLLNKDSKNYNELFATDFQKLVDDKTTVYSFKQWDKPNKDTPGQTLYGVAFGIGKDTEGRNLVGIEYSLGGSPTGHKLEALFEEFDHGLQYIEQRIGYLTPDEANTKGPAFAYDFYDEVDNKIARVKYISGFKEGSVYKTQLYGLNSKILKSNFDRKVAENHVEINYPFTDREELNAFQALSKASQASEAELRGAYNNGKRWENLLIGTGKN